MTSIQERMDSLLSQLDEGVLLRAFTRRHMRKAVPGGQQTIDKAWSSEPAKTATSFIPSRILRTLAKTSQAISGLRQRFGTKKKLKPQASDQDLPGQDTA